MTCKLEEFGHFSYVACMKVNSDASLKVAAGTFKRFKGDWTAVHRAAEVREDGVLVIKDGASKAPANRRRAAAAQAG